MTESERAIVLIVESERDLAERYTQWLRSDYDVRVARNGSEAVAQLDGDIDVVIIDLETSDMSCEEILDEIANRDVDCRVAMVGGADPGFDGTSIGFDEYLTTPLTGDERRGRRPRRPDRVHGANRRRQPRQSLVGQELHQRCARDRRLREASLDPER